MKTATLAKKRIDAIQQLIQAGNNDIDSWAELTRRLREDERERTNLSAYFSRCKRQDNPQLMSLEMAAEVAKAFVVEPNTIYIELGEGEELPTAQTKRHKAPSRTDIAAIAKKAPPVQKGIPITISCPELGINITDVIAHKPQGDEGPCFGALSGRAVIMQTDKANHYKLTVEVEMNGSTDSKLLGLVFDRHDKVPQEA